MPLVLLALMYWTTVAFLSFRPAKLTSLLIIAAISLATCGVSTPALVTL